MEISELSIRELEALKEEVDETLKRENSDQRVSQELKDVAINVIKLCPGCNGIVLAAAWEDQRRRFVYNFEEIEESKYEGVWIDELGDELRTVNAWLTENTPETELDLALTELLDENPKLYEMEIDWTNLEDKKFEFLMLEDGSWLEQG
ncbi:MAG: hypothetical protein J6I84_03150 [Bacilli bacterium]|nr:hypothetical protein [Bacilli bacterium]